MRARRTPDYLYGRASCAAGNVRTAGPRLVNGPAQSLDRFLRGLIRQGFPRKARGLIRAFAARSEARCNPARGQPGLTFGANASHESGMMRRGECR
jgi:hypothetical protein